MNFKKHIPKRLFPLVLLGFLSVVAMANPSKKHSSYPPLKKRHTDMGVVSELSNTTLDDESLGSASSSSSDSSSSDSSSSDSSSSDGSMGSHKILDDSIVKVFDTKINNEDRNNLICIQKQMPDRKIIAFCPDSRTFFSQIQFNEILKKHGIPFKHHFYLKGMDLLNDRNIVETTSETKNTVIYFGENMVFNRHGVSEEFPYLKNLHAFTGYQMSCDIIMCGSEFSSVASVCNNRISGRCILYKPTTITSSAFSSSAFTQGLYLVSGIGEAPYAKGGNPISSGRGDFATKHIRYLYGSGLMESVFQNFKGSFKREPSFEETLAFVMSEPSDDFVTRKRPLGIKPCCSWESCVLHYALFTDATPFECCKDDDMDADNNIAAIKSTMLGADIVAFCPQKLTLFSREMLIRAITELQKTTGKHKVIYFGKNVVFRPNKEREHVGTVFGDEKITENYIIIFDRSVFGKNSIIHNNIPNSRIIIYRPNLGAYKSPLFFYGNQCRQLFVLHNSEREYKRLYAVHFQPPQIPDGVYYLHFGEQSGKALLVSPTKVSNPKDYLQDPTTSPLDFDSFLKYTLGHSRVSAAVESDFK